MGKYILKFFVDGILFALVVWAIVEVNPYRNDFWGAAALVGLIVLALIELMGIFVAMARIHREWRYRRFIGAFSSKSKGSHVERLYGQGK